ncbi:hypothetical protein E2C01_045235 [Portunus trituberculatus]|uniref:Uncharacterized protein n=1 Tax=Portunus trituberculatus TaxID=210409 RepID=A0A5B7FV73_PORTR|nr:hypothetical protein [Portunus trituberculatus]
MRLRQSKDTLRRPTTHGGVCKAGSERNPSTFSGSGGLEDRQENTLVLKLSPEHLEHSGQLEV